MTDYIFCDTREMAREEIHRLRKEIPGPIITLDDGGDYPILGALEVVDFERIGMTERLRRIALDWCGFVPRWGVKIEVGKRIR